MNKISKNRGPNLNLNKIRLIFKLNLAQFLTKDTKLSSKVFSNFPKMRSKR